MFMIVLRHFIIHPLEGNTLLGQSIVGNVIDAICYIGVDCFIIISGYYRIRISWKGFLTLFIICSFYGTSAYLFHIIHDGAHVGRSLLFYALMPFSHSCWWFINAYLILYLCSPILNAAANQLNNNKDLYILGLLTIVNVYFGNIMQTSLFNDNGYNASQMVFMYWIGICLKNHIPEDWSKEHRLVSFNGYLLCTLLYFSIKILKDHYGCETIHLGYNNLLTVIASVLFFLFVSSFQFKSRAINFIAESTLAAYLIQEHSYLGAGFFYPLVGGLYNSSTTVCAQLMLLFAVTILFFCAVIIIDQIRKLISKALIFTLFSHRSFKWSIRT